MKYNEVFIATITGMTIADLIKNGVSLSRPGKYSKQVDLLTLFPFLNNGLKKWESKQARGFPFRPSLMENY